MTGPLPFKPRTLAAWLVVAVVFAAAAVYFNAFSGGQGVARDAVGPTTFSRSAIGHAGIADVLRRLGINVIKGVSDSPSKVQPDGVLIVAEPDGSIPSQQLRLLLAARTVLLVLPKRVGARSRSRPEWIDRVILVPENVAELSLTAASVQAEVVRTPSVSLWSRNEIGPTPSITAPVQLIKSQRLRPVVASADGLLVGELRSNNRRLFVLADPDVLQNHGIDQPANAAFAVALINALRGRNGNVVFDETVHGYAAQAATPWAILFEFPFVLATLQGALAVALLLWATMGRFGAPLPPAPALESGKHGLIRNTAKLFEFAGYQAVIVQRYVHALVRDVARLLHGPPGLSDREVAAWLDRVGRGREVETTCATLLMRADDLGRRGGESRRRHGGRDPMLLAALARDTYRWKREIIDGRPGYSDRRRGDPRRSAEGGGRPG